MNLYFWKFRSSFRFIIISIFILTSQFIHSQNTRVQGIVTDSVSGQPIEFATVSFENTTIGNLTDENGKFSLTNNTKNRTLVVTLMGYETQRINVPLDNPQTQLNIKLKGEGIQLTEVVVRRTKEKYVKKDNPAVALIKKVIEHKNDYLVSNQSYYADDEYERLIFALNDFKPNKGLLKKATYLGDYTSTSLIEKKTVLPFLVRETSSNVFFRNDPKGTRRVITGYKSDGIDKEVDTEALDGILKEMFKDINITDNNINFIMTDFVSPLSSTASVNFYKWYITDTIAIEGQKYINLGFVPFNTRDVGFIGDILVKADSTYAVKKVSFRVPNKINVEYLDEMLVVQEFKEITPTLWIPERTTVAMDVSMYGKFKIYIEKVRDYSNFIFDSPVDEYFKTRAPEIKLADYKKRDSEFWDKARPPANAADLNMAAMIEEMKKNKLLNVSLKVANVLSSQYVATHAEEEKNKFDIGCPLTFISYNDVEGARFRLTGATNVNFNKHLFLYGYTAYGIKDEKFKYYGEATWVFNKKEYHKDEFPKNNLSVGYKYDLNALGQQFTQAERDNILMSLGAKNFDNLTYNRTTEINYIHEYYSGLSFNINAKALEEAPAGGLKFDIRDEDNVIEKVDNIKTTQLTFGVRWATNEKFFQQRRMRRSLPSPGYTFTLNHTIGLKDVLGGDYSFNKSMLSIDKEFWVAPYGRLGITVKGEKIWGEVPFTNLLSGNANTSITVQRGTYYMLNPMEFVNDSQLSWDVSYYANGWILNRIPLINRLKLKEVFGFRGFWGNLSDKNNPEYNNKQLMFPKNVFSMSDGPYMEYSIGVQNVLQFFRIDYVRRVNYLGNPDIDKNGFRISFDKAF